MAKEWAKSFYKSKEWQECREAYIAEVNGLCERCLENGKVNPGKIVHHIEYLTPDNINDPEITLNFDNLEYLCLDCHNEEHGVGASAEVVRQGLKFNKHGELIKEE
jgi:5-methylcytosine-specific restriction endonuclease McrA